MLAKIAEDETRHAELAWRATAWAITVGCKAVRDCLESAMAQKTTCAEDGHNGDDETETGDLLEYGIVDPTLRRGLRRAVLAEVVLPSARQLLSRSRVSSETLVATLPSERLPSHVLQSADKLTMDRISLAS